MEPPQRVHPFLWFLAAAYLALAVVVGVADIAYLLRHYVTFPFGDHWVWLARLYERGALGVLYAQFNEHRLTVPGLFYLLDYRYFGGHNALLIVVLLLFQLGCIVLLILPVWQQPDVIKPVRYVYSGFVVIVLLWFLQGDILFFPFNLTVCANCGVLLALHLFSRLARCGEPHGGRALGLWLAIFGCSFWATFSFGHGMLIWPVLLVMALAVRLPKRTVALVLLVFAIALAAYFPGYRTPPGSASPIESVRHPVRIAHYATALLGLPFFDANGAEGTGVRLTAWFGTYSVTLTGILLAVTLLLRCVFARAGHKSREEVFYCSVLLWILGAAFLAALGRSHFPIEQALSGRYAPLPLIFWVSLAGLVTIHLSRLEVRGGMGRAIWCVLLALASAMTFSWQIASGPAYANHAQHQLEAAISIAVGAPDEERVEHELDSLDFVSAVDRYTIRDVGHSFFTFPQARWLQTPMLDHLQLAPAGACLGSVNSVDSLPKSSPPGFRLVGWAWDASRRQVPSRIWVTDQQDIIRGLGVTHESRPDIAAAYGNGAMESAGWVAYAPMPPHGGPFTVYAELKDGKSVCQVGGPRSPAP